MRRLLSLLVPLVFCAGMFGSTFTAAQSTLSDNPVLNSWLSTASSHSVKSTPYERNLQRMTEHQVLSEIERLQSSLDELSQNNRLDSATYAVAAGVLGTVAYGIAHAQLVWLFRPAFFSYGAAGLVPGPSWINAVLRGIIDSFLPGLAVGAMLGVASYLPEDTPALNPDELAVPGSTFIVSALGMTLLGSMVFPVCHHCVSWPFRMLATAFISVPLNALGMLTYILSKRLDLQEETLNLKYRLREAKETLRNRDKEQDSLHPVTSA